MQEVQFRWYSKKGFTGKNVQRNPCNECTSHEQNNNYVQLSAKNAKFEKSNRKLKCTIKKCKRNYDSDSDDSDTF